MCRQLTAAEQRLESELDEIAMMEMAAGLDVDPGEMHPGEQHCRHCGEIVARKWLDSEGFCNLCKHCPGCDYVSEFDDEGDEFCISCNGG